MWTQRWLQMAWPAFLAAAMLEMLVFALVDPNELHWLGQPVTLSREAVYTLAFFAFWGVTMASSALTAMLSLSAAEVNRCPVPGDQRPSECNQRGSGV
ncbi:MAG: hypothetical protein WEK74_04665 [Hydrogenophaga sp.]